MRISKKVFTDLAIFMIGFGLVIGIIFPFFVHWTGVPKSFVYTPFFIILCVVAGIIVGGVNIFLARQVVGKRLKLLSERMRFVDTKLSSGLTSNELVDCSKEECIIPVDSEDEIGASAQAFNELVSTLSNSMRNEHAIKDFNELLTSQLELEQLSKTALNRILDFMKANAGAVIIEQGGDLLISSSSNIKNPESLLENDSVWTALRLKNRQLIKLAGPITVESPLVSFTPTETIVEPLIYKDVTIGVVVIASALYFDQNDMYGFEMFVRGMALALRNAITYDQLQKLAANDPLTGLYNRRFGMIRLNEEFSRAIRSKLPLGVIMFDIDHFKTFNDTYGHTVGDKVLVNIANVATNAVREGDFLIRYGGEEFLVLLPGASMPDTEFVAERLRHMIDDFQMVHNKQDLHVTISAGFSSYPDNDVLNDKKLVDNADKALYSAKKAGRNRVHSFSDLH